MIVFKKLPLSTEIPRKIYNRFLVSVKISIVHFDVFDHVDSVIQVINVISMIIIYNFILLPDAQKMIYDEINGNLKNLFKPLCSNDESQAKFVDELITIDLDTISGVFDDIRDTIDNYTSSGESRKVMVKETIEKSNSSSTDLKIRGCRAIMQVLQTVQVSGFSFTIHRVYIA